jgi:hypothetical protein
MRDTRNTKMKRNLARAFVIASVPFFIGASPIDARTFGNAKIVKGSLTAISEDVLSVNQGDEQFNVEIDDQSKVLSKYYSKIDPKTLKSGDLISIWGKWVDEAKTMIQAKLVRDLSREVRKGVVNGLFTRISATQFSMTKANGKVFTITFDKNAKIMNRKGNTILYSDIKDNDHLAVTGLVDHTNLTVVSTSKVRDLDLPQI